MRRPYTEVPAGTSPPSHLSKKTSLVMLMTLLSRIGGFLRDVIFAHIFGATADFDAFVVAFRIPNFMRRLFGEGAFSQALVPVIVQCRIDKGETGVRELIHQIVSKLTWFLLSIILVSEIGAPLIVLLLAPGFVNHGQRYHLAVFLVRVMLPYLFTIGLVAVAGAILNAYHRFTLAAFTPVLLNVGLIAAAIWWVPQVPASQAVIVLAWSVILSGIVQLVIQWPALRRFGWRPRWRVWRSEAALRRVLPAIWGVSAAQVSLLVDNMFASFLPAGSISWLYYADRLLYFPLGIIGVALATVVMPYLARHHHQGAHIDFDQTLDWALRGLLVTAIPAALGLILLAGPILATLMHHGAFNVRDVIMTERALIAFIWGLPALMAVKIFAGACYAQSDMRAPARAAGWTLLLNLLLNGIFILPLAHAGLALATALASWFNAVLLWRYLRRRGIWKPRPGWLRLVSATIMGGVSMGIVLWWARGDLERWLNHSALDNSQRLFALISVGIGVYFLGLWTAGLRWRHFSR